MHVWANKDSINQEEDNPEPLRPKTRACGPDTPKSPCLPPRSLLCSPEEATDFILYAQKAQGSI